MTKKEAAIVAAYTGVLIGKFSDMRRYIEEKLHQPVFTHELASKKIIEEIKKVSKNDFCSIIVED